MIEQALGPPPDIDALLRELRDQETSLERLYEILDISKGVQTLRQTVPEDVPLHNLTPEQLASKLMDHQNITPDEVDAIGDLSDGLSKQDTLSEPGD